MNKTTKTLFALAGIIFPNFIGALHTFVHFQDLVNPDIHSYLQQPIDIMGDSTPIWNAWGMMSVMMGISFIVIGILNIETLKNSVHNGSFPFVTLFGMIVYNLAVIYVGHTFDANPQYYGGMLGLTMILICLATTFSFNEKLHLSTEPQF